MSSTISPPETIAELLHRLGDVAPERIRMHPSPGTAVEDDVERCKYQSGEKRLLELVEGTLVEKAVGQYESQLAVILSYYLFDFLKKQPLGILLGADAGHRLEAGLVRMPDVGFISRPRLKELKKRPAVVPFAPDLAVEVISPGNTSKEMDRKLVEYFDAGVKLVWYVYPETETVLVYRHIDQPRELTIDDMLDGEDILPGFQLSIREWFAHTV